MLHTNCKQFISVGQNSSARNCCRNNKRTKGKNTPSQLKNELLALFFPVPRFLPRSSPFYPAPSRAATTLRFSRFGFTVRACSRAWTAGCMSAREPEQPSCLSSKGRNLSTSLSPRTISVVGVGRFTRGLSFTFLNARNNHLPISDTVPRADGESGQGREGWLAVQFIYGID